MALAMKPAARRTDSKSSSPIPFCVYATVCLRMDASSSLWSTSEPHQDHCGYPLPDYREDLSPAISSDFKGEDLEIILSDSEDQVRPTARSKRRKRKSKPSPVLSHPHRLPVPSSVTMKDKVLGQMAPKQQLFCPFLAVSKYPYRYVKKTDSEPVSRAYFAGGKLRARGWSIYYLHTTISSAKPLLLVPAIEFRSLLAEINKDLNLQLKFPDDPGFLLNFLEDGSPRPRYLGRLSAENPLDKMESQIPGPDFKLEGEDEVDDRSLEAFRVKMEAAIQAGRNRSKGSKEKRKKARVMEKKGCCLQLRRTQHYLGMKPVLTDPLTEALEWPELEAAYKKHAEAVAKSRQVIDMTKPVPYDFYKQAVFISIDVEWYERSKNIVTEIGISSLDTTDLVDIAPGEGCIAWMDRIQARHFRIKEHAHLINSDFVTGCGDKFEAAFGTSEWISLAEAPKVVASCFRLEKAPALHDPDSFPSDRPHQHERSRSSSLASAADPEHEEHGETQPKRNIVLVGHDIKTDVDHLRAVGFDVTNMSNILEVIDTADIFRALKHEQQPRSLGAILLDLGLTGWNLHNAGNDAAYTLQAMLGIAFKALDVSRERRAAIEAARDIRIEDAAKDAQQHVREDFEEWDLVDVEDHDEAARSPADAEVGKSVDAAVESANVDADQMVKEEANQEMIDEAEAERLALAAGDDIGDNEAGQIVPEPVFPDAMDIPRAFDDAIGAVDGPISDRKSISSSLNVIGSCDTIASDNEDDRNLSKENDLSPLEAEMLDRLNFLNMEDNEAESDEEGGVKL